MRAPRSTIPACLRAAAPLLLAALLVAPGRAADVPPSPTTDAQRLVFLLEYIGTDYDGAVRDGQVANQVEYGEMLRFSKQLAQEYSARRGRSPAVTAGLAELQQLIQIGSASCR